MRRGNLMRKGKGQISSASSKTMGETQGIHENDRQKMKRVVEEKIQICCNWPILSMGTTSRSMQQIQDE
jgi:hypothetical protein